MDAFKTISGEGIQNIYRIISRRADFRIGDERKH